MASKRQIKANRKNAARSTGPRTFAGKQRVRRNALRHGLSRCLRENADEILSLARSIETLFRNDADVSFGIAHAKSGIAGVRSARHALLTAYLADLPMEKAKALRGLDRYERAMLTKQRKILII